MEPLHQLIADYLAKHSSDEGLFDPIEKRHVRNGYGNAFFSLLCDQLYLDSGKIEWKKRRDISLKAELKSIKNYSKEKGLFRWEFKNYALLSLYYSNKNRKSKKINKSLTKELESYLQSMIYLGSYQTNYFALRGINYLLKYLCFGDPKDKKKAKQQIRVVLSRQTPEGFFWDTPKHKTFQYHAFTLMLLCKFYSISKWRPVLPHIKKGLKLLKNITDNNGDFNYFGRSQRQLFGYGNGILAFSLGHSIIPNQNYDRMAKLVLDFIKPHTRKMRIVMNKDQDLFAGWYKYNCLTDHITFSAYTLLESDKLLDFGKIKKPTFKNEEHFLPSLNIFLKRASNYFVCVCAEPSKAKSQPTGLVHICPKVVSTSGGAPYNLVEGYLDSSQNFFGPKINGRNPFLKNAKLHIYHNSLSLISDCKDAVTEMLWDFNKGVSVKIKVKPKRKTKINLIHYVADKPLESELKAFGVGQIISPEGLMTVRESKSKYTNKKLQTQINMIQGKYERQKTLHSYIDTKPRKPTASFMSYYILMPTHFAKVFIRKIKRPREIIAMFRYYNIRKKYYVSE